MHRVLEPISRRLHDRRDQLDPALDWAAIVHRTLKLEFDIWDFDMNHKVRTCSHEDIPVLARTIREAFRDVAVRFGLTPDNAPRHPSNCAEGWIEKELGRGTVYFVIEAEGVVAGCVGMERAAPEVVYLERLGVLPAKRRRGLGKALVEHVLSEAGKLGARRVDIGIIAAHEELRAWYEKLGFVECETRDFPHLPFRVTFMSARPDAIPD